MRRALIFFLVLCAGMIPRLRRIAHTNLRIAFGPAGRSLYLRTLIRLSDTLIAILKSCRRNPSRRPKILFNLDALSPLTPPPPWVLVTGHLGPVELMSKLAEPLKTPMSVVVRPPRNWFARRLLNFIRRRIGTDYIDKRNVVREAYRAMSQGKSVAILADHNAGYQGVFLPFLGFAASTTRLPAVLAMRFQKPVVIGFIRKEGSDYLIWIEKVILPDPSPSDEREEEHRILEEMNTVFTDVIHRYPDEWFWFHRRWKTRPGDREAHILR